MLNAQLGYEPIKLGKAYAGIGSRKTPPAILEDMRAIGAAAAKAGWSLYSGNAGGADQAFAHGATTVNPSSVHLMLPWPNFESGAYKIGNVAHTDCHSMAARELVEEHYGQEIGNRTQGWWKLMMRNCYQVLGPKLENPVKFVLFYGPRVSRDQNGQACDCWGGTGMAVRIAYAHGIPCMFVGDPLTRQQINQQLGTELAEQADFTTPVYEQEPEVDPDFDDHSSEDYYQDC